MLLQRSAEEKWEQIVGTTSYLYGSESVGGAHRWAWIKSVSAAHVQWDYPIAIALEGEASYEIEPQTDRDKTKHQHRQILTETKEDGRESAGYGKERDMESEC